MKKLKVLFVPVLLVFFLVGCITIYDSIPGWKVSPTTDITLGEGDSVEITATVTHEVNEYVVEELLSSVKIWYYYKDASGNTLPSVSHPGVTILNKNIDRNNSPDFTYTFYLKYPNLDSLPDGTDHLDLNFSVITARNPEGNSREGFTTKKIKITAPVK